MSTTYLNKGVVEAYLRRKKDALTEVRVMAASEVLRVEGAVALLNHLLNSLGSMEVRPPRVEQVPMSESSAASPELPQHWGPGVSLEEAISAPTEIRQRLYRMIYLVLANKGPLTDEELHAALDGMDFPHSLPGLRARRTELASAGWVTDTGKVRPSTRGKVSTVWAAEPEEVLENNLPEELVS